MDDAGARQSDRLVIEAFTLYGVIAVTTMLAFYALEDRAPVFVLAFAAACLASAVYGFAAGAWPSGFVEIIWAGVALTAGAAAATPTCRPRSR